VGPRDRRREMGLTRLDPTESAHAVPEGGAAPRARIGTGGRQRSIERGASTEPAGARKHRIRTFGDKQGVGDRREETSRDMGAGPRLRVASSGCAYTPPRESRCVEPTLTATWGPTAS
jgi:hypothetical protein